MRTVTPPVRAVLLHVGVWVAYAALAVGLTWPLAWQLSDHVIDAPYSWDALTNTMILGTRVHNALGIGAGGIYDAYFFAPIEHTIVFNENLFGLSLLYAPIYLVTHAPILSYNLVLLWSLSLSGYFTFLWVRRIASRAVAEASDGVVASVAFMSGAAFAFCPYVVFELGRIQLVATQWLPLCLWFLDRALLHRRWRDHVGLSLAFALQVGTCLYYALFLLPIMLVIFVALVARERAFDLRALKQWLVAGGISAVLVAGMVWPYFEVRERFDLTRTEDYAQSHDGKLAFLRNVHTANRVWVPLRQRFVPQGAHEEIAFPGLTVGLLALMAAAAPVLLGLLSLERSRRTPLWIAGTVSVVAAVVGSYGLSAATGTLLAAVLTCWAAYRHWRAAAGELRFVHRDTALYFVAALLAVALFLGIEPMRTNDHPVHGLYYYLFTYVPGFDGIRKVSRQAIVVMLMLAVLAGIGGAWALTRIKPAQLRWPAGVLLGALAVTETFSAPMKLTAVPAGNSVPDVYHFIARKKEPGPIAVIPARDGRRLYRGHPGQAVHNYQALYHRHRTINGKSSWIPPVTRLFDDYMNRFPNATATRLLLALGTRQLVVHAGDFGPERALRVSEYLDADRDHYELIARSGSDSVYRLKVASDEEGWLIPTPSLGAVRRIDNRAISINASLNPKRLRDALDDDPLTTWSSGRPQRGGDWVEITLDAPRAVSAIEIIPGEHTLELPLSFEIHVADPPTLTSPQPSLSTVLLRPRIFVYEDQVHSPKSFVWRVLLPQPGPVSRVRITVREALAGQTWTIPELRVWESAKP